ncbi:hypothetical protein [Roseibium sp. Sym1]|uniref:hypothetical protein n=1 Tax=Roseibium sp. Sym1 TaxID=3016006 RepID=UPI0022B3431D|nr:hypothetical protein [Roseibium sp. Sym1]
MKYIGDKPEEAWFSVSTAERDAPRGENFLVYYPTIRFVRTYVPPRVLLGRMVRIHKDRWEIFTNGQALGKPALWKPITFPDPKDYLPDELEEGEYVR